MLIFSLISHLLTVSVVPVLTATHSAPGHNSVNGETSAAAQQEELERKWDSEWGFSGISTFAHLPHVKCLTHPEERYDIAIVGAPFDTAVSYRPGARFGPRAIRAASARQTSFRGFNPRAGLNPYRSWAKILDCGDIPITPFDNALALTQMSEAFLELGQRVGAYKRPKTGLDEDVPGERKPKLITLGGDHSIALPALRALKEIYGQPIAVLHFDAHLDTWHPAKYPSAWSSEQSAFNHGSMFWLAGQEGLIRNGSSVHGGLRTRLSGDGWDDFEADQEQGWMRIAADEIDDLSPKGVIDSIMGRIGTDIPLYLSVDIDVLDSGLAPGTGTPEPGGWTSRELIRILRGVQDLNIVGADIVEVAPSYDGAGEQTALAAAQVVFEILTSLIRRGILDADAEVQITRATEHERRKDEL
ncbi:MAG: hypothetical protein M1836_001092 [Candelina mexicana]|nr:MAG: hypothetical protein M1836_001092 [Candelina mexicana]